MAQVKVSARDTSQRSEIRVLVYLREPEGERGVIAEAYGRARELLEGTPGLRGDQLLRSVTDPRRFTLVMEWESRRAYAAWEKAHRERGHRSPLRPYQDRERPGGHYEVFALAAGRTFRQGDAAGVSP
ncbi:antibiotic biosynthesis monooxygenase family protein [Thermomonospora amylolytica]|uniref:antibiotic biosynthesis monooxygenase family protein n=1 Tax=Thermomonospora amylolytica TaxID=1411117 RepID=UPI000E6CFAF0|nr:antibiotic biosynthesis monooxygenase [Thermomonospora amylolytica]